MASELPIVNDAAAVNDRLLHFNETNSHSLFSSGFTPNHVAFWTVNAVIVIVLFSMILWCCKFGGADSFGRWIDNRINRRPDSDLEYARRVLERQQQVEKERMDTPEKRKAKLKKCFQRGNATMVVEEKNFVTESDKDIETGVAYDQSGDGLLSFKPDDNSATPRVVPNCCAVCITPYQVGDNVIWSANCPHAFHQECVVDWFVKMQDGTPCPCCRQEFTDLKRHEETRKKERRTPARAQFDVTAISLR